MFLIEPQQPTNSQENEIYPGQKFGGWSFGINFTGLDSRKH